VSYISLFIIGKNQTFDVRFVNSDKVSTVCFSAGARNKTVPKSSTVILLGYHLDLSLSHIRVPDSIRSSPVVFSRRVEES